MNLMFNIRDTFLQKFNDPVQILGIMGDWASVDLCPCILQYLFFDN